MSYDEEYAIAANGGNVLHPDSGDRAPLLNHGRIHHDGQNSPRNSNGGGYGNGGMKRKPKIIPKPINAGSNNLSSGLKTSNSMKTAITAGLIFIVTMVGMGYVYNSEENIGKSPIQVIESLDVKEAGRRGKVDDSASKDDLYDICRLNTHSHVKESCSHPTTDFTVLGNDNGRWPTGFSWTVLKDSSDLMGDQKSFLHTERGDFDHAKTNGHDIQCKKFVTELCLTGDYVVYANSDNEESASSAVSVCNKKVVTDEALDFSADHVKCVSSSFELDPDLSEFKSKRNKHATVLQALSMSGASGAPMTSGTTGGSLSGATMDGSMPQGSMASEDGVEGGEESVIAGDNETSVSGNETVVVGGNETAVVGGNETAPAVPGEPPVGETPPTVRPTTAMEYFFPPPPVPTAAPTALSSFTWDGSPPTIERAWNYTKDNTSKIFTEDIPNTFTQTIPEKWDQTTQGFKYPTAAPTPPPSNADGSTSKPTTVGELFYPPTISVPLGQGYGNVTTHDYNTDWNNTINGFAYPTAAPTIYPTVRPTMEGEVNKQDCYMFGMLCDTPVSQQPSAEPTVAVATGEEATTPAMPVVGATPPSLRSRLSTSLATSGSSSIWNSVSKYIGPNTESTSAVKKDLKRDPSAVIADANKLAAAQVQEKSLTTSGMAVSDISIDDNAKYEKKNVPLDVVGIGKKDSSNESNGKSKSSHHHMHGSGGGAAVVEVAGVVAEKTKEGVEKASPIVHKIASNTIKQVQSTLTEASEKMKQSKPEKQSHEWSKDKK